MFASGVERGKQLIFASGGSHWVILEVDPGGAERGFGRKLHSDRRKRATEVGPHPVRFGAWPASLPPDPHLFYPFRVPAANTSGGALLSISPAHLAQTLAGEKKKKKKTMCRAHRNQIPKEPWSSPEQLDRPASSKHICQPC